MDGATGAQKHSSVSMHGFATESGPVRPCLWLPSSLPSLPSAPSPSALWAASTCCVTGPKEDPRMRHHATGGERLQMRQHSRHDSKDAANKNERAREECRKVDPRAVLCQLLVSCRPPKRKAYPQRAGARTRSGLSQKECALVPSEGDPACRRNKKRRTTKRIRT